MPSASRTGSSRRRITASPAAVGIVTARTSTERPSIVSENRPSCASRVCAMSRPARILTRLITGRRSSSGTVDESCNTPSMRIRIAMWVEQGSMCRSDAWSVIAWVIKALTSPTIGPSSTSSTRTAAASAASAL